MSVAAGKRMAARENETAAGTRVCLVARALYYEDGMEE